MSKFEYYPNYSDPRFYEKIVKKKEFYINKIPKDRKTEMENCDTSKKFELLPQQSFLKNFINMDTPYQSMLIFHGVGVGKTISAVSIAENFSEMLENLDSKIYVLTSGNETKVNFRDKGILSPVSGEKYMTREERQMVKELTILDTPNAREEVKRIHRRVDARIKRQGKYKLVGYEKFVHQTIGAVVKDKKTGKDKKDEQGNVMRQIIGSPITNLDNSILIIDEAHRVVNENDYGESIRYVLTRSTNFRLILLTATPMFHGPDKIVELINLLHLPSKPVVSYDMLFNGGNQLKKDALKIIANLTKGYISYARGKDPNTFPNRIDIGEIPAPDDVSKREHARHTKVVRCEMTGMQLKTYKKNYDGTKSKNNIYMSNMVLPNPDSNEVGLYSTDDLRKIQNAPINWLKKNKITVNETDTGVIISGEFLRGENLKEYSMKYYKLLKNMLDATNEKSGLIFIYIEDIVGVGLNMIKEILLNNGYLEYISDLQKNSNDSTLDAITGLPRNKYKGSNFSPSRFITIYGESDMKYRNKLIQRFTSPDNQNGEFIKVCLGSKVTRESIDFKNIRQIHIMNAQWEFGSLEQIVGRGIRNCSHAGKTGEKRNVYVYKYVSSLPGKKYQESLEEKMYREEEKVDIVTKQIERVLKEGAVDCVLNKYGNVFPEEIISSKGCEKRDDCPALCEYQECNYKCEFELLPKDKLGFYPELKPSQLNTDTYTINMAKREVEIIKKIIDNLFKLNYVYTIENLLDEIYNDPNNKYLEEKYIFLALTQMIDNKEEITDRFGIPGYIIYRGVYYIFQPMNASDSLTVEERIIPSFDNYKKVRKLGKVLKEKIGKETLEEPKKIMKIDTEAVAKMIIKQLENLSKSKILEINKLLGSQRLSVQEKILEIVIEEDLSDVKGMVINNYSNYLIQSKDIINFSSVSTEKVGPNEIIGYALIYKKPKIYLNKKWRDATKYLNDEAKIKLKNKREILPENKVIIGYISENKDGAVLKLRPHIEITTDDRRKIPSGFVCKQSSNKDKIFEIAKKLNIKVSSGETINTICDTIEDTLRKYQLQKKDGKTWLYEIYQQ
jgi:superfamily II DNA or RNA helicase